MNFEIRPLQGIDEYEACVDLQQKTWGKDFLGAVPVSILMVSQKIGGITAGAFDDSGNLVGCVYGLTGFTDGQPVHWSDILAVKNSARGHGIGKRLKLHQRDELLKHGVAKMFWTYDPLQSLNANLNFNALGALPSEYVVDMYGETASELHSGGGTDRFIVQWDMASERVKDLLAGAANAATSNLADAPVINTEVVDGTPAPAEGDLMDDPTVHVEIPPSINDVKAASAELGEKWRTCTRRAFTHYMDRGYNVSQFVRDVDGRCFYVLETDV